MSKTPLPIGMRYPDGSSTTPLEIALHGLRCIAVDAGTMIDWHGEQVECDAAICKAIAQDILLLYEHSAQKTRAREREMVLAGAPKGAKGI